MDNHPESKPKFLTGEVATKEVINYMTRDKWAERLWPCMAWTVFLFNLLMCVDFAIEVLFSDVYDYVKHITIAATMCASYIALIWTHTTILRRDNGLD